jgi:hypothetical protein
MLIMYVSHADEVLAAKWHAAYVQEKADVVLATESDVADAVVEMRYQDKCRHGIPKSKNLHWQ